jgi:FMNH2-dependent dimethyl sulfone monooxygenase
MRTCTWAPTVFQGPQIVNRTATPASIPADSELRGLTSHLVQQYEQLGITDLLIAQRWWGSGTDIEGSSLDCLAMTAYFAAVTQNINLVTAIHPGFFQPTSIAKWGATIDQLTGGRWSINVTSGWNMEEFDMYGIDQLDHDQRYRRSKEFIDVLNGCWTTPSFSHEGEFYKTSGLRLEPTPQNKLEIFQGGQSPAAMDMAASHSDWMFLNGGDFERIESIVTQVKSRCEQTGRQVQFAMYAAPLCRSTDEAAWREIENMLEQVDHSLLSKRRQRLQAGAQGMWSVDDDALSSLDTNEGYASRLIGSPETILKRIREYQEIGISMLHLDARDRLFNEAVLPLLVSL